MPLQIPGLSYGRPRQYGGGSTFFNGVYGDNPIERFFGGNQQAPATEPIGPKPRSGSSGYENTRAEAGPLGNLGIDRDIQDVTERILQSIERGNKFNLGQREKAIDMLTQQGATAGGYYNTAYNEVSSALPLNPFSDALKTALMTQANDQITTQTQDYMRRASENLAARGLSSGGSSGQTAAGGVFSESLGKRVDTRNKLEQGQLEFNTAANQTREGMLSSILDARAKLESEIGGMKAGIQAGNVIDPTRAADEIGAAFGLQMSRDNQEKLDKWIEDSKATFGEKFLDMLPLILAGFMPSAGGAQALLTGLSTLSGNH